MKVFTRQLRAVVLVAVLAVGAVGLAGCGDNGTGSGGGGGGGGGGGNFGSFTYDGQTYKTVKIGGKTWMAENLNVETDSSWCYDNDNYYCNKYGRLYTWSAAKTACQSVGWHLPTRAEWDALMSAVGSPEGTKLKSRSDWSGNRNGTDDFGFSALPGGYRNYNGAFYYAGSEGHWWTAGEHSDRDGVSLAMAGSSIAEVRREKVYGHSARCIED